MARQELRPGASSFVYLFFVSCCASTVLSAESTTLSAIPVSGDIKTETRTILNNQEVTFYGRRYHQIVACTPSSFVAFDVIERTKLGECFCCAKIPRHNNEPLYAKRFPRQFPNAQDLPALAVFTSDTGSVTQAQEEPRYHYDVYRSTDTNPNDLISKISRAATELLKPLYPGASTFEWTPTTVVVMKWLKMCENDECSTRNNYELYLAINNQETIAIFNFSKITWANKDIQMGFNAGNDFDFLPISVPNDVTQQLRTFSEVPGELGQLMYLVSSDPPRRLGCIKDVAGTYRLEVFSASNTTILGGEVLKVSGPCLDSSVNYMCSFLMGGEVVASSPTVVVDTYCLKCSVPRLEKTGKAVLRVQSSTLKAIFEAPITVARANQKPADIILSDPGLWSQRSFPEAGLTIKWKSQDFQSEEVILRILGYSEATAVENRFKILKSRMFKNTGEFTLKPEDFSCDEDADCALYHMGFLSLRGYDNDQVNRTIWSDLLPLAWFVDARLTRTKGRTWPDDLCNSFEPQQKQLNWSRVACPCKLDQAQANVNQFVETFDCPTIVGGCANAKPAQRCFRTIAPKGSQDNFLASLCCFERNNGFLLYSEDIAFNADSNHGSRGSLLQPNTDLPQLSFFYRESLAFFYCCVWREEPKFCPYFNLRRPTPSCQAYRTGGTSATIGDPHIISFGKQRFTINAQGDFSLLYSAQLKLQGRFQPVPNVTGATVLTAVAFSAGQDASAISVLLTGGEKSAKWCELAFRNGSAVRLIRDEYQHQGVLIRENPAEKSLHVMLANEDERLGFVLRLNPDFRFMNLEVSINPALQGKTFGLLGRWFGDVSGGVVTPDGQPFQPWAPSDHTSLVRLSDDYRLTNAQEDLFYLRPPWILKYVNIPKFKPKWTDDVKADEIPAFCEYDQFCAFDDRQTKDTQGEKLGRATLEAVKRFDAQRQLLQSAVPSCGRPDLPTAIFSSNDYSKDAQVEVTGCQYPGSYELKQKITITCRAGSDGVYRWEPNPSKTECTYIGGGSTGPSRAGLIAGLFILFIFLLVLVIVAVVCFIKRRREPDNRQGKKPIPTIDSSQSQPSGPVPDAVRPYHYHAEESGDVYAFPVPARRSPTSLERTGQRVSQTSSRKSSETFEQHEPSPRQQEKALEPLLKPVQEQVRRQLQQRLTAKPGDEEEEEQREYSPDTPDYRPQEQPQDSHQQPQYYPQQQQQRQQPQQQPQQKQPQQQQQQQQHPRQQQQYNPQHPRQQQQYNPQYQQQHPRQQQQYNPQYQQQHPQQQQQQQQYNPQYQQQHPRQQQQQQQPRVNMYQKRPSSGDYRNSQARQSGGFVSSEAAV